MRFDPVGGSPVTQMAGETPRRDQTSSVDVDAWLVGFAEAVTYGGQDRAEQLFTPDGSWRDLVALTRDFRSVSGLDQLAEMLDRCVGTIDPQTIELSPLRTPQRVKRAGHSVIEAFFNFRTTVGNGLGVVRLEAGEADCPRSGH